MEFTNSLNYSQSDISTIEELTKNQSNSDLWYQQRKYRLTASKFGRICKRMETLKSNPNESPQNLLNSLLCSTPVDTYATRHGIASEPHAKINVIQLLKDQGHKSLKSSDSGTIIDEKYPFLSASPDQIIFCKCCGKGLIEIKCPYTIRDVAPSVENLQQIDKNTLKLKTTHEHYFQIQGQLGISKALHCWYFVYTAHGFYLEKIFFDEEFFTQMLQNLIMFWNQYMAKELLYKIKNNSKENFTSSITNKITNNLSNNNFSSNFIQNIQSNSVINVADNNADVPIAANSLFPICKSNKSTSKAKGKKSASSKKGFTPKPIYLCSVCKTDVPYNATTFEENSINCEICEMWFHFGCVDITDETMVPSESDSWYCKNCTIAFKMKI